MNKLNAAIVAAMTNPGMRAVGGEAMRRRNFVLLLGGAAVAWPLAAIKKGAASRPSDEDQSIARAWHTGQNKPVFVTTARTRRTRAAAEHCFPAALAEVLRELFS
jgi:hypothetical protein